MLQFLHCQREQDVRGYQSQQFDLLLFDEATEFTYYQIRFLIGRNRATVNGVVPFCAMATNPGGVSHGVIKRQFVDPGIVDRPFEVEVEPGQMEMHMYIPARLADNQVLEKRDPGYRKRLEALPEDLRRAFLEGDWSIFAGQYFREFRREKHVIPPFTIPDTWPRFISLDWGYAAPHCVLWHALDKDTKRVITYREMYGTQKRAAVLAAEIVEASHGEKIRYVKGSPDMWQERGLGSDADPGRTIAEEFEAAKLRMEQADNRRVMGWTRMREYMADAEDDRPLWQCFDTCVNLIRCLPELIHDPRDVEDVSDQCEDHAPEALRYGLMSRPPVGDLKLIIPGGHRRPPRKFDDWPDDDDEHKRGWW
jgi:hypothetical protein